MAFEDHPPRKLLIDTAIFSLIIFIFCFVYSLILHGEFELHVINSAVANTAMILIGLSFALSGICYFWNFADDKIIYRKYLGLMGFYFAIVHVLTSVFSFPLGYFQSNAAPFIFGLLAFLIFLMMTLISNKYAVRVLGGKIWRGLLRLGYLAYVFAILHFSIRSGDDEWHRPYMPTLSLLITIFGIFVILLRLAVLIDTHLKKRG